MRGCQVKSVEIRLSSVRRRIINLKFDVVPSIEVLIEMLFSHEDLQNLEEEYLEVFGKYNRILLSYSTRSFNNARAKEYAQHGISRRLKTLVRCIENIFDILPPDRVELPTREELSDVNINLQAFMINVFGCVVRWSQKIGQ